MNAVDKMHTILSLMDQHGEITADRLLMLRDCVRQMHPIVKYYETVQREASEEAKRLDAEAKRVMAINAPGSNVIGLPVRRMRA